MKTSTYYILLALAVLMFAIESADACSLNPTAVLTTEPDATVFYNGDPVLLSGENSTANCGSINQYRWRVRPVGGSYTTIYQGSSPTYNYTFPLLNDGESEKSYDIELRVRNSSGLFGYAYMSITVKHSHDSYYYLTDHLGSVRVTVNERGDPMGWDDYYPFGLQMPGRSQQQYGSPLTDVKYTGYELNQEGGLGLYHAGARLYDPEIGRFMQQDRLTAMYPGLSPYVYALNNPIRYLDPDGNFVVEANKGGIMATRFTVARARRQIVSEMLPGIGYFNFGDRTLRNDPSFRPSQADHIVTWSLGGVGKGFKTLGKGLKNLARTDRQILQGTGSTFEGISGGITMLLLSEGDIQNLQSDASVFEKALQTEVDGFTLAVAAKFVTTEYFGRGERDGYYAPDTEFSGGVPDRIMLNPQILEKWKSEGHKLDDIVREFNRILEGLK